MKKLALGLLASLCFATAAQANPYGTWYTLTYKYEYSTSVFSPSKICVYQRDVYVNGVFRGSSMFQSRIYKFQSCQAQVLNKP